ncbi:MAG: DUF1501 domain-containing protein [Planctomycetota bacterium]|nr:DUF1501 domain-containing protein [Planctomycetota bacterium]MDA0921532.1 DUF1501 domain-containing protein [Planctomycetota bacterium]MDA1159506.1 DUF1501 domain-containing protein [Planctomycetota bacterium]
MTRPTKSAQQTRRQLVSAGSLGLFGMSMPTLLAAENAATSFRASSQTGKAKACILLFMWGGPGHQDTWDLKPHAPAEIRGEFQPIPTNVPGIQICEHFPKLAQRTDKLAIIRSMTHDNVNHTTATHYLLTGQAPPPGNDLRKDWPHIGSVLSQIGRGNGPIPPFVSMRPKLENTVPRFVEQSHGQFAGWLGPRWDPLTIDANPALPGYQVGDFQLADDVSIRRLAKRRDLLESLEVGRSRPESDLSASQAMSRHYNRAYELLTSAVGRSAFDLNQEAPEIRDRYGRNPHGQSVLQARRLVERGVPLVTVFWPNDGIKNVSVYWDTHSKEFIDHKTRLMPPADLAFSALLDDLSERGMLDETLVVWTGEFGRTPKVGQRNSDAGAGQDGRDHWPNCFTSVLAGGGISGGQVYGSSDRHAAWPASDPVQPVDLAATIYHQLGVPSGLELMDHLNRPFVICPGQPISALIS